MFFDANNWKTLYEEDYLQKFECFQDALEKNNPSEIEYWFVLILNSLFNVLRKYFASKGLKYFKIPDIIRQAADDKIMQNELIWLDAYRLSTRIGRAVRSKEENIDEIRNFMPFFMEFHQKIKRLFAADYERKNND